MYQLSSILILSFFPICGKFMLLFFLFLLSSSIISGCVKPNLYVSANMRSVLLPSDTAPGSVIYRLRAQDAEDQYPITFTIHGRKLTLTTDKISILLI